MISYPTIDPDIIRIGPLHVRWYGLMYILGFLAAYWLIPKQKRSKQIGLVGTTAQDLILYLTIGLVAGARLGYILFYQYADLLSYLQRPLSIIAVWQGGMSFHGGLAGCLLAGWLFSRRKRLPFWAVADSVVVTAPIGLFFGRLGNFINGELYGRVSDVPWAMVFPEGGPLPRHPSQLYEALLEGLLMFVVLWHLRKKPFQDGTMVALFLCLYGMLRFVAEFFREPDAHLGFIWQWLSMGQILCGLMFAAGTVLLMFFYRKPQL